MQGTIKKIISHRGYGFISVDEHEDDIFFHRTAIEEHFDELEEGQEVEFELEETEKGPQANNIKLI